MFEIYEAAAMAALERASNASNSSGEIAVSYASFIEVFRDRGRGGVATQPTGSSPGTQATWMPSISKNLVAGGNLEAVTIKDGQNRRRLVARKK